MAAPTARDVIAAAHDVLAALATLERVGLAYAPAHYRPSATHAFKDLRFDLAVAVASTGATNAEGT